MDDRELRASLRRLPEARPDEVFTAEVLARVERDERRRAAAGGVAHRRGGAGPRWRPTLMAAALATGLVAAGLWSAGGGWRAIRGEREEVAAVAVPDSAARRVEPARAGGGEGGASSAAGDERLGEGDRGHRAGGDEVTPAVAADRQIDESGGSTIRGGSEAAEDMAAGASTEGAVPTPARRGSSAVAGTVSPQRPASQRPPLADGVLDERAHVGAFAGERPSIEPPAAPSPASDFFAAPPAVALPAAERLARLREEREQLERRLAAFRSELPPAEPPVVLLGGEEGFDLVFDLGRWAAPPPAGAVPAAARPAVHSTDPPPRRF